jgi:hypothetical protein
MLANARECTRALHWLEVERVMGIEPTLAAWEAAVLPLNYTRFTAQILLVFSTYQQEPENAHR